MSTLKACHEQLVEGKVFEEEPVKLKPKLTGNHTTKKIKKPRGEVGISKPEIHQPDIHQPKIHKPDIHQPEIHEPEIHQPEISEPEIQQPEIPEPEIQQPDYDYETLDPDSHQEPKCPNS